MVMADFDQLVVRVGRPTYDRVSVIKKGLQRSEGRQVTFSEAIDRMAELWERAQAAVDAKETG
jgi:hypothetical protein